MLRANVQADKVMEVLAGLPLAEQELEIAEKYLKGETGEDSLAGMAFRNMEALPDAKVQEFIALFRSHFKRKRYDEAAKLFNVVYAIGGSSCHVCFQYTMDELRMRMKDGSVQLDHSKVLAALARKVSGRQHQLNSYTFISSLSAVAQSDFRVALRAYREDKAPYSNGKVLLLTLYFYLRYDKKELEKGAKLLKREETHQGVSGQQTEGLLGGLKKFFGTKPQTAADDGPAGPTCPLGLGQVLMDGEDKALLQEYEEMLVSMLGMLFLPDASGNPQICEIQRQIRQGSLTQSALVCVRGRTVNELMFRRLGGCAYINYMLSERLRFVAMVCGAADARKLLETIEWMDIRGEVGHVGGELEELFCIPNRDSISWAADRLQAGLSHRKSVEIAVIEKMLHQQFRRHREDFLASYKSAGYQAANAMAEIIRKEDPALYKQEVLSQGDAQRDRVIALITARVTCPREVEEYLAGRADLSTLYPLQNQQASRYGGHNEKMALDQYDKVYHDEDFYGRCMAYMALIQCGYFFTASLFDKNVLNQKELEHIFRGLDRAGTNLAGQLGVMVLMVDSSYLDSRKQAITDGCIPVFGQYLAERTQEMEKAFSEADACGRYFALRVYGSQGKDAWRPQILSYSQDSSKLVKQELEQMLVDCGSWREQVRSLLSSKKAAERELGIRVLARWNTQQDKAALQELYAGEKSAKLRALLDTALGHEIGTEKGDGQDGTAEGGNTALTREDLVKNLHKGGKKRSLSWAYETPFSPVHRKSGEQATEEYLQALLLCYCSMAKPGINTDAALLAEDLEPQELAVYVGELFDKWMNAGAEAKKRWVLYAASIHGGAAMISRLHHQIQEWPQNSRGAIAAEAVQALALNPQPQALLIVDGIARKFKFKQVKAAAGQALEFAAGQLGLTREQLEDKIVPSLGFDENMERRFDYGSRSFTVTITPALEVEIFDEGGKKLKNMPAPGARDEAEKAAAAYAEFKEMKKQMKATVTSQKQRLELALSAERLWTVEAWRDLFVGNPIMHQFAIGLVWGLYEEHKLVQSFRYMEDGSFNTQDEEEYTLPEQGTIGLVHPIELEKESLETWKQQLEDYEIIQPIEQLSRAIYFITPQEQQSNSLERFGGMILNDLSLGGKLTALGWYRGSVQDAGGFYTYYREDPSLGLGAELHFSGSYVGSGSMGGEEITVYDVRFYKAGEVDRSAYSYDEVKGKKQLPLKDIPQRYFSEIIWQMTKATVSSKERDENWKSDM